MGITMVTNHQKLGYGALLPIVICPIATVLSRISDLFCGSMIWLNVIFFYQFANLNKEICGRIPPTLR